MNDSDPFLFWKEKGIWLRTRVDDVTGRNANHYTTEAFEFSVFRFLFWKRKCRGYSSKCRRITPRLKRNSFHLFNPKELNSHQPGLNQQPIGIREKLRLSKLQPIALPLSYGGSDNNQPCKWGLATIAKDLDRSPSRLSYGGALSCKSCNWGPATIAKVFAAANLIELWWD